jgi:hypothetical protein
MLKSYLLTKKDFLAGLDCPQKLWYARKAPAVLPVPDEWENNGPQEAMEVGLLARRLYPGGLEIPWELLNFEKGLLQSREAVERRRLSYEAGFIYHSAFAKADILMPAPRGRWDLIEVKSTPSVKGSHFWDMAFQRYIMEGAGLKIRRCFLLHINRHYLRTQDLDLDMLFYKEDITAEVYKYLAKIPNRIKEMQNYLKSEEPPFPDVTQTGCSPRHCDVAHKCWSFLPERHVFLLYRDSGRRKAYELVKNGVYHIKEIPDDFRLTDCQAIQVQCEKTGKPHIHKDEIRKFIEKLQYPLFFLDFETFSTAIPRLPQSAPFENIPFQYSLHIVEKPGGSQTHHSYISDGKSDPRPEILARLKKQLGNSGSIIAYNKSFEQDRILQCAERFPQYAKWAKNLMPRFIDLLEPFQSFHIYHPAQKGSASLKSTLPALTGKRYDKLEIRDGAQASKAFMILAFTKLSPRETERIRSRLEDYCSLDTGGMIDMLRQLKSMVR